jgi:hypothetical protein
MEPSAFFYVPLTFILSPKMGERIKVRGHELSIRRSIIYTNVNKYFEIKAFAIHLKFDIWYLEF